jgi:hypothetical protein
MGDKMNVCRLLVESQKESDRYEDLDIGVRITLKWMEWCGLD